MRKRMVTRTITSTVANIMSLNITEGECVNITVEVPGTYKNEDALMKACKKAHESAEIKFVKVVEQHTKEALYGMSEEDFLAHAQLLPERAKKETEA